MKVNTLAPWRKNYDQPRQHIKKQRHYFANKGLLRQSYGFSNSYVGIWASLVVQWVKRLPAMWETQVRSPGREDPLEKGMATHSSTLLWKIPWTGEPGGLQSMELQRIAHN